MKSCFNCKNFDANNYASFGGTCINCNVIYDKEGHGNTIYFPTYRAQHCLSYEPLPDEYRCYTFQYKADDDKFTCHSCEFYYRERTSDDRATIIRCNAAHFGINSEYDTLFKNGSGIESNPSCPYAYYIKHGYSILSSVYDACSLLPPNRIVQIYKHDRTLLIRQPAGELLTAQYKKVPITFIYDYTDFTEMILIDAESKLLIKHEHNDLSSNPELTSIKRNNLDKTVTKVKVRRLCSNHIKKGKCKYGFRHSTY